MSKPCTPCRSRKLKCDGAHPTCSSCARARKSLQCVYEDNGSSRLSRSDLLQKGAACTACRRKKKKCDGSKPFCSTCKVAGKEDDCTYEDGASQNVRAKLQERIEELENALRAYEQQDSDAIDCDDSRSLAPVDLGEGTSSSLSMGAQNASQNAIGYPLEDFLGIVPAASRGMQMVDEVDIIPIRALFLSHRAQTGLCLTQERLAALQSGNTSVIHPALLYAAQLWGCAVNKADTSYFRVLTETVQLQNALDCLNDSRSSIDPTTAIEAHQIICMFFFAIGKLFEGREQLLKASHVVLQYDCHLLGTAQSIQRQSTYRSVTLSADEDIAAMCQVLYMDQAQHIQFKTPLLFSAGLYTELAALPELYSVLALESFCVVARAIALLYHREAEDVISTWAEESCCTSRTDVWYSKYTNILNKTQAHLAHVQTRLVNTLMVSDDLHARALKVAELLLLGVLINLHSVLAPSAQHSRQEAVEAVKQILKITESFKEEDYIRLCPMISFSWIACVNVMRLEMGSLYSLFTMEEVSHVLAVIKSSVDVLSKKMPYVYVDTSLTQLTGS